MSRRISSPEVDLGPLDWERLAAQKHQLVKIDFNPEKWPPLLVVAARGLLGLLDRIQDEARAASHPVVYLTPQNEKRLEQRLVSQPERGKVLLKEELLQWLEEARQGVEAGKSPEGSLHYEKVRGGYIVAGYVRLKP